MLFKQVYSKELADRSAAARTALATKLLEQSTTMKNAPADQFVLLSGAIEAGKEASDLGTCTRTADAMADTFEVDGLRIKTDAALKMALRAGNPAATADNCAEGMGLVDQLVAASDLEAAAHLLANLRSAAPDSDLSLQIQMRAKDVEALRAAATRAAPYLKKLKTAPNDPAANLEVGQFLCFIKGDWERGLPHVARGTESPVRHVAALDLAGADDPAKQAELGDLWWDLEKKENGLARQGMRRRASSWYDRALPRLEGLHRLSVQKHADEAANVLNFDWRDKSQLRAWNVSEARWAHVEDGLQCRQTESALLFKPPGPVASITVTFTGRNADYFWVLIGQGRYRFHYLERWFGVLPPDFDRSPQPELWKSAQYDLQRDTTYSAKFWVPADGRPAVEFEGIKLVSDKFRAKSFGPITIVSPAGLVVHSISVTMR